MTILHTIAQLKKRAKKCMSKEQVTILSKHLRPLVNEAHDAQVTDRDLTIHHVQFAQITIASIQMDIEQTEAAAKQDGRTTRTSPGATDNENQTHSGNVSKKSGEGKEACLLYTSPSPRDS